MSSRKNQLRVSLGVLEYHSFEDKLIWAVAAKDIVLMAEYTNDEGPILDDYFLVFVSIQNGIPFFATASFYSEGRDEVVKHLGAQLAADIELGLAFSTEWESRIVWPPALAGQEYFECMEVPPNTVLARLRKVVFGPTYEYVPTKSVRAFLGSSSER